MIAARVVVLPRSRRGTSMRRSCISTVPHAMLAASLNAHASSPHACTTIAVSCRQSMAQHDANLAGAVPGLVPFNTNSEGVGTGGMGLQQQPVPNLEVPCLTECLPSGASQVGIRVGGLQAHRPPWYTMRVHQQNLHWCRLPGAVAAVAMDRSGMMCMHAHVAC